MQEGVLATVALRHGDERERGVGGKRNLLAFYMLFTLMTLYVTLMYVVLPLMYVVLLLMKAEVQKQL
jgi:hypothetical protein